jgi:rhodanese-related sulfurtransferase
MSNGKGAILPDVRSATERSEQLIRGSVHIPLQELSRRLGELEMFRNNEIIWYCRSGNRSLSAAATLRKHGFKSGNLQGGIVEWNSSGHK